MKDEVVEPMGYLKDEVLRIKDEERSFILHPLKASVFTHGVAFLPHTSAFS